MTGKQVLTKKSNEILGSIQELGGVDLALDDRHVLEVLLVLLEKGGHG